jgi:hypothetical protein
MKQTSVEWLEQRFNDPYNNRPFITKEEFEQAKAMEKDQMKDAALSSVTQYHKLRKVFENQFERYYNETYNK